MPDSPGCIARVTGRGCISMHATPRRATASRSPRRSLPMQRVRTLVLGVAGRDFHDFNLVYRADAGHEVVGFTAQQIPHISGRRYPPELAGPLYPEGIPIFGEERLEELVRDLGVALCVMAYSDVAH